MDLTQKAGVSTRAFELADFPDVFKLLDREHLFFSDIHLGSLTLRVTGFVLNGKTAESSAFQKGPLSWDRKSKSHFMVRSPHSQRRVEIFNRDKSSELDMDESWNIVESLLIKNRSSNHQNITTKSERSFGENKVSKKSLFDFLDFVFPDGRPHPEIKPSMPAAGAIYSTFPLVFVKKARGLKRGVYKKSLTLEPLRCSDSVFQKVFETASQAMGVLEAPNVVVLLCSDVGRLKGKYPKFYEHLATLNCGVVIDRMYLSSQTTGLLGCAIGHIPLAKKLVSQKLIEKSHLCLAGYAF